jgi:hypothetical protein
MARANPGALNDPLVVGVYHLFKILIGDDFGGNVSAERGNFGSAAHDGADGKAQFVVS